MDPAYQKAKAARFREEADRAGELALRADDGAMRGQLLHIARVYRMMADKLDPPNAAPPTAETSPSSPRSAQSRSDFIEET